MNNKFIFLFSLFSICLLLTSCFLGTSSEETTDDDLETESIDAEETIDIEDVEINIESSNVERSSSREVIIESGQFNPRDITISIGDTVQWVNVDSNDHTVSFEDARFDVEVPAGSTVSFTFSSEEEEDLGEARYFCKFHPSMQGSVLIE